MEPEGSLPHSQVPTTSPYPEPVWSSPYPHIVLPEDPSSYYPPIYAWVSPVVSFPIYQYYCIPNLFQSSNWLAKYINITAYQFFFRVLIDLLNISILLSWASSIQSIPPHPNSWRFIFILSSHLCLGLPSGLFLLGFPIKILYMPLPSPICATCPRPSHSS